MFLFRLEKSQKRLYTEVEHLCIGRAVRAKHKLQSADYTLLQSDVLIHSLEMEAEILQPARAINCKSVPSAHLTNKSLLTKTGDCEMDKKTLIKGNPLITDVPKSCL